MFTNNVDVAASSEGRCGRCFRSRKIITLCIYVISFLSTHNFFHNGFGKLRSSMVLERMIVGSIPRRILGRFRASQATRPPRQGLLSTNIPNSMFLFPITGSVPDIFHLSSRWLSAIGYWLFAKPWRPASPLKKNENRYFAQNHRIESPRID
jgi:hypothetical protein